jgi:hypothetical protein
MPQKISEQNFYFDEPRLRMSLAGRALVRIVKYVTVLVLVAAALTFLLSYDIHIFFYSGLFLLLIVLDLLVHHGDGDIPIPLFLKKAKTAQHKNMNVAATVDAAAFSAIERSMDRSIITKKSFLLELARRLLELPAIENSFRALEIKPEEFRQKIEALMADDASVPLIEENEDREALCRELVMSALTIAASAGHEFIQPNDLFAALPMMGDESLDRLFALFSIEERDLTRALIFSSLHSGFMPKSSRRLQDVVRRRAIGNIRKDGMMDDGSAEVEPGTVLIYEAFLLEKSAHISISFGAITCAAALAKKHGENIAWPSGPVLLLKAALVEAERRGEKIVTADRVTMVFEEKSL